jgi:hypothetical protein
MLIDNLIMKHHLTIYLLAVTIIVGFLITGCGSDEEYSEVTWDMVQDTTDRVTVIEGGLQGPEAVQYDSDQDVYFVSNFNGNGTAADSNGFISRAQTDGAIDSLKFMVGTEQYPLHAPRGMYIVGDTLFVADQMGVHGFDRYTGQQIAFTDFTNFEPGFLNDLAMGADSSLYVTDSGKPLLYRMSGANVSIAVDSLSHVNNGIMYDRKNQRLILAPWGDGQTFLTWNPLSNSVGEAGTGVGGLYDGIEPVNGDFIVTSQADSTLQLIRDGEGQIFIKVPGNPADIGLDTQRNQVAVPYIALDRVDVWQLPDDQ